jgi:hypothetical protein
MGCSLSSVAWNPVFWYRPFVSSYIRFCRSSMMPLHSNTDNRFRRRGWRSTELYIILVIFTQEKCYFSLHFLHARRMHFNRPVLNILCNRKCTQNLFANHMCLWTNCTIYERSWSCISSVNKWKIHSGVLK